LETKLNQNAKATCTLLFNGDSFIGALIEKYNELLDKGMEEVADYPDLVFRVRTVKNQINYAILDIAKKEVDGERGAIMVKDGKRIIKPEYPDLVFRVRTVKNQINCAILDIAKKEVDGERGAIMVKDGKRIIKPEIEETLAEFLNVCELYGVTRVHEWHTPPREFVTKYRDFLKEKTDS